MINSSSSIDQHRRLLLLPLIAAFLLLSTTVSHALAQWKTNQRKHELGWLRDDELHTLAKLTDVQSIRALLRPILVERQVGTMQHDIVANYLKTKVEEFGFTAEWDSFSAHTPMGVKTFHNLVATFDPLVHRRLVLACHYDSKIIPGKVFVGATDSALPCALLLDIAKTLGPLLASRAYQVFVDSAHWPGAQLACPVGIVQLAVPSCPDIFRVITSKKQQQSTTRRRQWPIGPPPTAPFNRRSPPSPAAVVAVGRRRQRRLQQQRQRALLFVPSPPFVPSPGSGATAAIITQRQQQQPPQQQEQFPFAPPRAAAVVVPPQRPPQPSLNTWPIPPPSSAGRKAGKLDSHVTLQLVFLDGEEAFHEWSHMDSIYGARHLAEVWERKWYPSTDGSAFELSREIDRIDVFMLLDLLGAKNPRIQSTFGHGATALFDQLPFIEEQLAKLNLLNRIPRIFYYGTTFNAVEDDHLAFMRKGVPVLHLIAMPFPHFWHTPGDNESILDNPTIENLATILRVFVARYLAIHPAVR